MEEVGTGVGYFCCLDFHLGEEPEAMRLAGRGRVGEAKGSKAGSNEGAGRFTPAAWDVEDLWLGGEESMLGVSYAMLACVCCNEVEWKRFEEERTEAEREEI